MLAVKGIRIKSLSLSRDSEGEDVIAATYEIITSADSVLADRSVTTAKGYADRTFVPSPQAAKSLKDAVAAYRKDVEFSLGFDV